MLKKVLLAVSTFAIAVLLFAIYQWQEKAPPRVAERIVPQQSPATQMEPDAKRLKVRGIDVPPGEKPLAVIYDNRGRPKIQFRSDKWYPLSESEMHMTRPDIRLILPGGEPVQATADEGQVVVVKEENNNYNPKRGWMQGNVHIVIDRTDEKWREKNPDRALPEQHPEYVVHLWLEDLRFDLDLARLESSGAIRIQSHDATVEGTELVLAWNEVDRRIDLLEIAMGKRMELRRDAGLVEFAMPGSEREQRTRAAAAGRPQTRAVAQAPPHGRVPAAAAAPATRPSRKAAAPESRPAELSGEDLFVDVTKNRNLRPRSDRIDTYTAVFAGPVAVSQKRGEVDLGRLTGNMLELLFDFGEAQKEAADVRPQDAEKPATSAPAVASAPAVPPEAQSRIELVWSGKMTIHPAPADKNARAGQRFHAVATGSVTVTKGTSKAECDRLEFHNETEQAWLSGSVRMRTAEGREMAGEKIFYDRRGGLARIDGPGSMTDPARELAGPVAAPGSKRPQADAALETAASSDSQAERAVVRWTKSVELKFGLARQSVADVRTAQTVAQEKEYLQHARFVGDVEMSQPGRSMRADEIVLFFAEPPGQAAAAEQLAVAIARAVATQPEKQAALAADLGKAIRELVTASADAQAAGGQAVARAVADHAAARPEDRDAIAGTVGTAIGRLLTAPPSEQATAAEHFAKTVADLGSGPPAEKAAAVARLTKAIAGLVAPAPGTEDVVVSDRLERMTARGRVRFQSRDDVVAADELVVTMTVDTEGRNVPARAEARGAVSASQKERRITAKDRLMVELASVPAPPLPPLDRNVVAARARAKGMDPAKIDWDALEAKRKNRRELGVVRLEAFGDVKTTDPAEKLSVSAEELHCWMPDGRQIERALVVGAPGREAEVEVDDRYVRAPTVQLDMKAQRAEVASAGLLRFRSYQDLGGERLKEPVPVTISWSKSMTMDGAQNTGLFVGDVHAVSRDTVVDCRELRVAFADIPTPAEGTPTTAPVDRYWIFGPLAKLITDRSAKNGGSRDLMGGGRKRPVQMLAVGDARALSTSMDAKDRSRILSRMQIDGPQLVLDLESDQMRVDGAGHLLIEDYRLPAARRRTAVGKAAAGRDPFGSGLEVQSPSQTLFTWQNAMSFFAGRGLAVFDRDVTMTHLSGPAIKLSGALATAMKVDVAKLQALKARRAGLRCDNLMVEFFRDRTAKHPDDPTPLAGATELKLLRATGRARMEEGTRSVEGDLITFNRANNVIRVFGSPDSPAQLLDQDEASGKLWRWWGESVTYNIETGQIDADWSVVSATGG